MTKKIYPITITESVTENYKVRIDGKQVQLDTARVSAMPFNRRWPGHQRGLEQTELINFLLLETDGPVFFEITPKEKFEKVVVRPLSLGIKPEISKDGVISFTLPKAVYFTVEPYGRNNALHVFADTVSNYDIDKNSADVIYFGKGEHDAGFITLKSNQTLFIDEGAVVYGCIRAKDAENIKILGRGILDNSKNKEKILYEYNAENNDSAVNNAKREHTIQIEYCNNVVIEGITIRDSLVYNLRPIGCKNLHISNLKIIGCWRYNSDGIDMHNCENVNIENCFLRTFDDSICIKGFDCYYEGDVEQAVKEAMYRNGKVYDVFKNVRIKNCVIWNDWGKSLEIGAETRAEEICDVTFENCDVIHVTGPVLDSFNIDYADVYNVTYQDINVEYDDIIPQVKLQNSDREIYANDDLDYTPTLISVITDYHHEYSAGGSRRGKTHDIKFKNIHLFGKGEPRFYFLGYDEEHKTKDVIIENVFHNGVLLKEIKEENFIIDKFAENVVYKTSEEDYTQMAKNNVDSKNQLNKKAYFSVYNPEGKGKRIMFAGNSITLHGILDSIGWHRECGMAASSIENDYVHILMKKIDSMTKDASYSICQVSEWERNYKNGTEFHQRYEAAGEFGADIIVMRFVENCPAEDFDSSAFKRELGLLLDCLNKNQKAKIILTTGFWKHPGDSMILEYAKENNLPCVQLGDLGELDEMKAIGLFEHVGVANHPGDLGMKNIADRIFAELVKEL